MTEAVTETDMRTSVCKGVVDGGMILLDDGQTVVLAGVKVPRIGLPGGAAMRTVLQRHVLDEEINYEVTGRDPQGYQLISGKVAGADLSELMNKAMRDYGYAG